MNKEYVFRTISFDGRSVGRTRSMLIALRNSTWYGNKEEAMNKLAVIVCGGRDYNDRTRVFAKLDELAPSFLIQGGARGADDHAAAWAEQRGVASLRMTPDWDRYGRAAGMIRNNEMLMKLISNAAAGYDVAVVAFPGGKGTANMIAIAKKRNINVIEVA